MPPKNRSSVEKTIGQKKEEKAKVKAKLNPWRTNHEKETLTDASHLEISKHESDRNTESAQTSMFKTKNNLKSK